MSSTLLRNKVASQAIHSFEQKHNSILFYRWTIKGRAPLPFCVLPTNKIQYLQIDYFTDSTYHTKFYFTNDNKYLDIYWPTQGLVENDIGVRVLDSWKEETVGIIDKLIPIIGNADKEKRKLNFSIDLR